ncbi:hypothetical protein TNIN_98601 [Trichonephila inaurata madagascariensis]|uniref:Zinc finger C3HC4 RING-type domain-containing protein n=1 Tax=Trichonephila inaurata madagascariensis TaxID=2747483 RepID=A0A8X6Y1Y7_9ARAC|nr:hypothetical protein TNIN_98601 [Trichonephila inaurata madagascariensis]
MVPKLSPFTQLAQIVLDGCYEQEYPDSVFQVPDSCPICITTMHWPEKRNCGHAYHKSGLLQHLDYSNTFPMCRTRFKDTQPIVVDTLLSPRKVGE